MSPLLLSVVKKPYVKKNLLRKRDNRAEWMKDEGRREGRKEGKRGREKRQKCTSSFSFFLAMEIVKFPGNFYA